MDFQVAKQHIIIYISLDLRWLFCTFHTMFVWPPQRWPWQFTDKAHTCTRRPISVRAHDYTSAHPLLPSLTYGTQVFNFPNPSLYDKTGLIAARYGHVVLLVHDFYSHSEDSPRRMDEWVVGVNRIWSSLEETLCSLVLEASLLTSDPLDELLRRLNREALPQLMFV